VQFQALGHRIVWTGRNAAPHPLSLAPLTPVPRMQLLFDFLPVIAFFVAYKLTKDIFVATAVIIVATVLQVAIHWIRKRSVNPMHLVSAGLVLVFGSLTLAIRNPLFIMWKVTVVNWLFAAAFIASQWLFGGRPIIQRLVKVADAQFDLEAAQWRRLNAAWAAFFLLMGAVNLVVFRYFDEETWVNFKLYGLLGLTLAFVVAQGFWIAAKAKQDDRAPH
jgi:intracellular septation protein